MNAIPCETLQSPPPHDIPFQTTTPHPASKKCWHHFLQISSWGGFDPNGPRIQAGYIVPGRGHQSEKPKPAGLQGSQHGGIPSFSIRTPKNSSPSNGSSSSSKDSNEEGLIQAPKDGWLLPDETDESVYKHKHLKSIQITKLPNDATSCREWRAAFLAAVRRVDMTNRDVLVKFATWCMEGGRGRRFRDYLQNSNDFLLFNKHVAAELIKPEVWPQTQS